ncbi:Nuclear receptor-interacting protein 2 [Anas platyrhynchos]|uniref:Nuclear receptor-interacting protein 2 n=1 Tax=Anas platyrhynchos TaxID=8839 RepID=R0LZ27_ANAPL|nr:Nuclear receptor-interacting protein 2 [Anas platyrhynchos]
MSTRKSCPLSPEQEDGEQKQSEGTPDPERQDCEVELRNKAILQQKRRLKQATQFVHKDSADLLPLDGLTRLGTSKDLATPLLATGHCLALGHKSVGQAGSWVCGSEWKSSPLLRPETSSSATCRQQPHSVVQRRLMEGNLNKLRGETRVRSAWVQSPLAKDRDEKMEKGEDRTKETSALLIQCQCQGQVLKATVNTGQGQVLKATVNTGCLPNLISTRCLYQLGLEEVSVKDCGDLSLPIHNIVGRVEHMELQFGQEKVLCSALVVDDEMMEFCIGLQTLLSLKVRNSFLQASSQSPPDLVAGGIKNSHGQAFQSATRNACCTVTNHTSCK